MAKLLNQGAYGCVYYPGFTCKGNLEREKKFVTKIEIYDKTSKNELDISKTVRSIKNYSKFFSPVLKHCVTKLKKIEKFKNSLDECEAVNVSENLYNEFILIYINYINGKEIEKYILSIETPGIYITKILKDYVFLQENIKKLQAKNIIHYDLHVGNILHDIDRNTPIIIDFGLSINSLKFYTDDKKIDYLQIKKSTMHYSPKHYTYPPELHFITYILSNIDRDNVERKINEKISRESIKAFIDDLTDANKVYKRYYYYKKLHNNTTDKTDTKLENNVIDNYRKELEKYYNKYANKTIKYIVDDLIDHIYYLDMYTLTIDYTIITIKILDKLIVEQGSNNKTVITLLFFIVELLINNLKVDPNMRMSLKEYRTLYNILFKREIKSNQIIEEIKKHNKSDNRLYNKFIEIQKYYISPDFKVLENPKIVEFLQIIRPSL